MVLVGLAILVQVLLLILMVVKFQEYFVYFYAMCTVLSMAVVLIIVNGNSNPGYKIAWLIPVLLVPVFGGLFYVIFGRQPAAQAGKAKDEQGGGKDASGRCLLRRGCWRSWNR